MKLLIVDDEMYIRNSLKNGFDWASLGFDEVLDAARVSAALEIVDNNKIDVIITDIKMPKLSGIDLIKELSSRSPDTKIIIISGHDKFEYAQSALKYGVADYLLKPARIEEVVEAVKKATKQVSHNLPEKYRNVLQKDFLCNLIFRRITDNDMIQRYIEEYELDFLKSEFIVAVLSCGIKEKTAYVAETICKVAENSDELVVFDDNSGHSVIIIKQVETNELILEKCNNLCRTIEEKTNLLKVECIIGEVCKNPTELPGAYTEVVQIADRISVSGESRAVFGRDIENLKIYNIVYMAKKYVCEHISEIITIQMISDMIHITPGYFSSIFRKATGESFVKYVNMQKIEKAKKLLEIWDKPVTEIADEIGFDVKYFNRVFKKYTQITPSEYRRMIKERR